MTAERPAETSAAILSFLSALAPRSRLTPATGAAAPVGLR